jgi:hypothetical protein
VHPASGKNRNRVNESKNIMSHEITAIDKQQGITQAWHGLTEVMSVILLNVCFLATWNVRKRPLYRPVVTKDAATGQITKTDYVETSACEVICTDDENIVIGKPVDRESYSLLDNSSFLAIVQSAMDRISGAVVASVGSVCARARIFVTLQIPQLPSFVAADREFKPYLNFLSSHDKSAPFTVNLSTVCTVCNNTFTMNLLDADNSSFRVEIRHTKNMADSLADVPAMIEAFYATAHKFATTLNDLAKIEITASNARNFFAGFLTEKDGEASQVELSGRRLNQIDRLTLLFATGKGNNGRNLADVFSAITDYYSHESVNASGKNTQGQIESSEFGSGAAMKTLGFVVLQDAERVAKLTTRGETVFASHEARERAKALATA